ncbi:hypothetical protein Ahy_B06g079896 [Arachis hypogaea]|uniref:RNase H type-1 domain-containing protein n=1 Tax=Arachis hypogaea TaxID=3818 RepID=A0A444YGF7_ARAHY|nr:hypothetical protein Ahy_B06g079896 [Arachis hypogaea]
MCWAIWKQRNNHIFQGKEINPDRTIQAAKIMQTEFLSTIEQIKVKHKGAENRRMRNVTWRAPPRDWLKINVDANFRKTNRKRATVTVLRDWQEKFTTGLTTEIRAFSSLKVEALALREALIIAKNQQLEKTPRKKNHLTHLIATQRAASTLSSNWSMRLLMTTEIQLRREAENVKRIRGRSIYHESAIEYNGDRILTVSNQVVIEVKEGTGGDSEQRSKLRLN